MIVSDQKDGTFVTLERNVRSKPRITLTALAGLSFAPGAILKKRIVPLKEKEDFIFVLVGMEWRAAPAIFLVVCELFWKTLWAEVCDEFSVDSSVLLCWVWALWLRQRRWVRVRRRGLRRGRLLRRRWHSIHR